MFISAYSIYQRKPLTQTVWLRAQLVQYQFYRRSFSSRSRTQPALHLPPRLPPRLPAGSLEGTGSGVEEEEEKGCCQSPTTTTTTATNVDGDCGWVESPCLTSGDRHSHALVYCPFSLRMLSDSRHRCHYLFNHLSIPIINSHLQRTHRTFFQILEDSRRFSGMP